MIFSTETYTQRRAKLFSKLTDGIALFMSNPSTPMNCKSNHMKYRQDSNFYYFFGINHTGYQAVMNFSTQECILFGDDLDVEDIIWMGQPETVASQAAKVGVTDVRPKASLGDYIAQTKQEVRYFPQYRAELKLFLANLLHKELSEVETDFSKELTKAVIDIRSVKEPQEVAEIEKCSEVLYEMHTTMMKLAKAGQTESFIAGTVEAIPLKYGGRVSFPVILSQNGQILHNHDHSLVCEQGRLLLCDSGAESASLYATDATRTVPVGGKFSPKQKAIYEIALEANLKTIEGVAPGVKFLDLHLKAARIIFEGLKKLGLCKGDTEAAVSVGAHALFFPHGLGHMMGLDVHDMEDMQEDLVGYDEEVQRSTQFGLSGLRLGRRLQENFVVTIEPGIYFIPDLIAKWKTEQLHTEFLNYQAIEAYLDFGGIRIEDDVLVTATGHRVLGKHIPKTVAEIENFMSNA